MEPVDKDGNPPQTANQRWYDKKTGKLMQRDIGQVIAWLRSRRPEPGIPEDVT